MEQLLSYVAREENLICNLMEVVDSSKVLKLGL